MAAPTNRHNDVYDSGPGTNGTAPGVNAADPYGTFEVNPWKLAPGTPYDEIAATLGMEDPTAQGISSFKDMFGHDSLTNPWFNRWQSEIAPGLGTIYSMLHGGGENPNAGFAGYMGDYINSLRSPAGTGGAFGRSDVGSLMRMLFSGEAADPNFALNIQHSTDREIMSMFGDILASAGFTGLTPGARNGISRAFQQLLTSWRGDALRYSPEQAGNAFLNYVKGSGILDKMGF